MASLWADVQLGMWDMQAGIPGKATRLGKECHIDRKARIGSSRHACVCVGVVKIEATVLNQHYHSINKGKFDSWAEIEKEKILKTLKRKI